MFKRFKTGLWSFGIGFCIGLSSCTSLKLDRALSAAEGNSATLFLSGPEQEPLKGRVYLEVREGANPSQAVTMHVPSVSCKRDSCVSWQLIRNDGSFGAAGSIPKGETKATLTLNTVTGSSEPVHRSIDGEYQALVRLYFTGPDGQEYQSVMRGYIRIVVLSAEFQPLGCDDPNVAWEIRPYGKRSCRLQWSSKLRSAKCGKCPVSGANT